MVGAKFREFPCRSSCWKFNPSVVNGDERFCVSKQCTYSERSKFSRLLLRVNPRKAVARFVAAVTNPFTSRKQDAPSLQLSCPSCFGKTQSATCYNDKIKAECLPLNCSTEFDDCQKSAKLSPLCEVLGVSNTLCSKSVEINPQETETCTNVVSRYSLSETSPLSHFENPDNSPPILQHENSGSATSSHYIADPFASFSPVKNLSTSCLKQKTSEFTENGFSNSPLFSDVFLDGNEYVIQEQTTLVVTKSLDKNDTGEHSAVAGQGECDETSVISLGDCSLVGPTLLSCSPSPYYQCNPPHSNLAPRVKDVPENFNSTSISPEASTEYASSLTLLVLPPLGKEFDFTPCGYEHLCVLARGQFGCTHIVRQLKDNTEWVAKVIELGEFAADEIVFTRREVSYLRRLQHPYIVQYHDSFETGGSLVIVMENCSAGDLFTAIRVMRKRNEYFPEEQILKWFLQIVLGLQYMHSQRILHCDLKTTNIFLTCDGVAKIGDFGIALEVGEGGNVLNPAEFPRGTPLYMSPEMCKNLPLSDKSDCWSLGCILYEICCLRHAFDGCCAVELLKSVEENISAVGASVPAGYSPLIISLISNLLQQEPEDRASLNEILNMLNNCL
ncbi:hypothetical protein IE077_000205 [Cardiosporidium cionae]|uniref:non-specific serine/threonine protein kinase n=1 Tax=Cardiosporidium cionae TaxID=476202 RepID=A0ABQ7J597_9APIC|nr:hypothetical protein IE077_000205 [Cardiosporidium cionae]|eukprot:KAF8819104.1 hypothetical protein IE077_000205 [Cardiosporidium cionae]